MEKTSNDFNPIGVSSEEPVSLWKKVGQLLWQGIALAFAASCGLLALISAITFQPLSFTMIILFGMSFYSFRYALGLDKKA